MEGEREGYKTGCCNLKELLAKYQAKTCKHRPDGLTVIRRGQENLYFGWNNYYGQYVQTGETDVPQRM